MKNYLKDGNLKIDNNLAYPNFLVIQTYYCNHLIIR